MAGPRDATRFVLAEHPDGDPILSFDASRAWILALPDTIPVASGARSEKLGRIVVDRVVVRNRQPAALDPSAPARPSPNDSGSTPKGPWGPARCLMRTPAWLGTWRERPGCGRFELHDDEPTGPKDASQDAAPPA